MLKPGVESWSVVDFEVFFFFLQWRFGVTLAVFLDDIILWTKPGTVYIFFNSQKVHFNLASVRQDSMKTQGAYFKLS